MSEKFIRAEELAEIMEISVPYAYKIIKQLIAREPVYAAMVYV
ncbi:hypothetical protein [Ruminococcus sp.]|nr:hypothetical protein [Ruminococcus sp.]